MFYFLSTTPSVRLVFITSIIILLFGTDHISTQKIFFQDFVKKCFDLYYELHEE